VQELILFLAEQLTGEPREAMRLEEVADRPGRFKLLIDPKAMGRMIGREGKVIKAVRALLEAAAAAKNEPEVSLDVDELRA
jgi:predicted RNA-binding protein YlqC (UPF0109 family)